METYPRILETIMTNPLLMSAVGGTSLGLALLLALWMRRRARAKTRGAPRQTSASSLFSPLRNLFAGATALTDETADQLAEALLRADMGVQTADRVVAGLKDRCRGKAEVQWSDVSGHLGIILTEMLTKAQREPGTWDKVPLTLLVVGVNGAGKTTTIGKMASYFQRQGRSVLLCAGDTYRAAAAEQLKVWGERLDVRVVAHQQGGDPAAVAFDGMQAAKAHGIDIVIIDTAGRLHNKDQLMAELAKLRKVIDRAEPAHVETLLVLDATTGQNALRQVEAFQEVAQVTGLAITKLDGTAKGGVVVGIADRFGLPIHFLGMGEKAEDLQPFEPKAFADSLLPPQEAY